ncbi:MAG: glycoside hydrolase family 2 TIM barrel-domain containing protein, partial [Planctomycetota bacterium]
MSENPRTQTLLSGPWSFSRTDPAGAEKVDFDDSAWRTVTVPHDWAIGEPFDKDHDVHHTAIVADAEVAAKRHVGRTGGLPHVGTAWYRLRFDADLDGGKRALVEFDGAMSHAQVFVNGDRVGTWPYGYASFAFDITRHVRRGRNVLAVRLDNKPLASRWYPGAGLYRPVRLITVSPVHVAHWGTCVTTPVVEPDAAVVRVRTELVSHDEPTDDVQLETRILDAAGAEVARRTATPRAEPACEVTQDFNVDAPQLWSPDRPYLYKAVSVVRSRGRVVDACETVFGIRHLRFDADEGLFVNARNVKLRGVCMHHDLGPLGAAFSKVAARRQLHILREMGCNALRTSHNPPAPQLLDLCDEMGFLVIDEAFDEWRVAKVDNGYHILFDQWAERDLRAMIRRDRNHPCVILWSIGNEVLDQREPDGGRTARCLTAICHREDPTRPTTAGFNMAEDAIANGLADAVDVVGWNYRPHQYAAFKRAHPEWITYGSETESCISSRHEYLPPPVEERDALHPSNQVPAYDLAAPSWGYPPDIEFRYQDECPFVLGQFVWTGWDYLGEPAPYKEEWPARSSYFGIVDLCGIPKDRYYLYQSRWAPEKGTLHLLPHWTWPGREGSVIPVHCYTSHAAVELFLNGRSLGARCKNVKTLMERYRLVWNDVVYEPGELKAVAYDEGHDPVGETVVRTAGAPEKLSAALQFMDAGDPADALAFVLVEVRDAADTVCCGAETRVEFSVEGPAAIAAVGNGDATSLDPFQANWRRAFHG